MNQWISKHKVAIGGFAIGTFVGFNYYPSWGWVPAIVLAWIGNFFDRDKTPAEEASNFILLMLSSVAEVDGPMKAEERKRIADHLKNLCPDLNPDQIQSQLTQAEGRRLPPDDFARVFLPDTAQSHLGFAYAVFSVIYADNEINDLERGWMRRMTQITGMDPDTWVYAMYFYERPGQLGQRTEWLSVLELQKGADEQAIKSAYRKKAAEYHPDKLAGVPESVKKLAEDKFKEITAAYQGLIGQSRGEGKIEQFVVLDSSKQWMNMCEAMKSDVVCCAHCSQKNRLPEPQHFYLARCGNCHGLLGMDKGLAAAVAQFMKLPQVS